MEIKELITQDSGKRAMFTSLKKVRQGETYIHMCELLHVSEITNAGYVCAILAEKMDNVWIPKHGIKTYSLSYIHDNQMWVNLVQSKLLLYTVEGV
jgi:hypothetical protein